MKIRNAFILLFAGLTPVAVQANPLANCKIGPYNGVTNGVSINCKLVQTVKPPTAAYPGVDASLLGIRTGMSVQQVEAIAAKLGLGRPSMTYTNFSGNVAVGNKVLVTASDNYIERINYQKDAGGNAPSLSVVVNFTSPATGNSSYEVEVNKNYPYDQNKDPLEVNTVMADLLHQFGPATHQNNLPVQRWLCWNFTGQSLIKISPQHPNCYTSILNQSPPLLADYFIAAGVSLNPKNPTKVLGVGESIGDNRLPLLDGDAAIKQLINAGKQYAQTHKALAGARFWINN